MTVIETIREGRPSPAEPPAPVGSSFYLGLRILPREQRVAMYAIYAFCRVVDDIADTDGPRDQRLARLDEWNIALDGLYAGGTPPTHLSALHHAIAAFGLARADFEAILEGMAMDVRGETVMPSRAALELYCDRVASAPGRLSVRVFGLGERQGIDLARHLGQALQLTNILRDIDEDAGLGRVYLPREALAAAGLAGLAPADLLADPRLSPVCADLAEEARRHFAQAAGIMDACPRNRVRAPRLMAAAYRPLLDRLTARGWAPPRGRLGKRKRDLMGAVLRFGIL